MSMNPDFLVHPSQLSLWHDGPPDAGDPEQLLTKRELADRIRKSVRWVEMQIRQYDDFPKERVGETWRFDWLVTRAWLNKHGERDAT